MPDTETLPAAGTSWTMRLLARAAGSVGAAVVLAGVVPAIANAAGANVPNPLAIALRAGGDTLSEVFTTDDDCQALDDTTTADGTASPAPEAPACDDHATIVTTVSHCAPRGEDPLLDEAGAPGTHGAYVSAAAHGDTLSTPWGEFDLSTEAGAEALCEALAAARAEATPTPSASESESEDANHGQIVSTVAKCAPKGKDPLLDVDGAPANHGAYVKVAAHGDTLSTPWGEFDLSTLSGAEQLCTALDAARATTSPEPKEKGGKGKGAKAGKGKGPKQGS